MLIVVKMFLLDTVDMIFVKFFLLAKRSIDTGTCSVMISFRFSLFVLCLV